MRPIRLGRVDRLRRVRIEVIVHPLDSAVDLSEVPQALRDLTRRLGGKPRPAPKSRPTPAQLTETQQAVLALLAKDRPTKALTVANKLEISYGHARDLLAELRRAGLVRRPSRDGYILA